MRTDVTNVSVKSKLKVAEHIFARVLADAIQHVHKDCKNMPLIQRSFFFLRSMPALSLLFFFVIERSVLMALVFYNKRMLAKVTIQRT